jgi:hypothetical protein
VCSILKHLKSDLNYSRKKVAISTYNTSSPICHTTCTLFSVGFPNSILMCTDFFYILNSVPLVQLIIFLCKTTSVTRREEQIKGRSWNIQTNACDKRFLPYNWPTGLTVQTVIILHLSYYKHSFCQWHTR